MNVSDVIKRSWQITWRFKPLWILGFFAGGASLSISVIDNSLTDASVWKLYSPSNIEAWLNGDPSSIYNHLFSGMSGGAALIIALLAFIISIVLIVLSYTAMGGLTKASAVADTGQVPKAKESMSSGFSKFWRVLGISFVSALPLILISVVLIIFIVIIVLSVGGFAAAMGGGSQESLLAASGTGVIFLLIGFIFFGIALIILATFMAMWTPYAVCAGVLEEYTVGKALGRSFRMIKRHFGESLLNVVLLMGISIGLSIVISILTAILIAPAAFATGVSWLSGLLTVVVAIFVAVVGSAYAVFMRALWTLTYRRLSALDQEVTPAALAQANVVPPAGPTL